MGNEDVVVKSHAVPSHYHYHYHDDPISSKVAPNVRMLLGCLVSDGPSSSLVLSLPLQTPLPPSLILIPDCLRVQINQPKHAESAES